MDMKEVRSMLKICLFELKCELTGWGDNIPVDSVKKWIKKVDAKIIKKIDKESTDGFR